MFLADRLTLDAPKRTADGYMAVRARAARTGVYQYAGREVDPDNKHGLRDTAIVNVLRDDKTVFDTAAVQSFIGKPVTDDHPSKPVTKDNWRDHARGTIMGALRDGDYLAFDILLTDADAIAKVDAGKRELSNGYGAELEFGQFTAADGTTCQARQSKITGGNHVALVDRGRAGADCRIADAATCETILSNLFDHLKTEKPVMKTMLIDGLTVDVGNADTAIATITRLMEQRDTATGKVGGLEKDVATKDARIATLEGENKTLTDAKPTPAQLRDAAKAYALVVDKAKALGVTVTDSMDEAAIKKAVVDARLGDKAAKYTAEQIDAAFDVLDAKSGPVVQSLGAPSIVANDTATIHAAAKAARVR